MTRNGTQSLPRWILLGVMTAALAAALPSHAARKKNEPAATGFAPINTNRTPLAAYFNDPDFAKAFVGTYGFLSEVEPKISTPEEREFFLSEEFQKHLAEEPEKAARELEKFITPETSAVFELVLGSSYVQLGDLTNAVKNYELAIAKFPRFLRAHKAMGLVLAQEQRFQEAAPYLTRAIELGGGDSQLYGTLGLAYLNLEQFLSAEIAFRNAVLLNPEKATWKQGLVKCLIETEDYITALKLIDEMLIQSPGNESLWALQAGIYLQMDRPKKAVVNLELLRKMGKADVKNLMLLGDIYVSDDSDELALSAYLEAIDKGGGEDLSRALRAAEILVRRGSYEPATRLFARIREVGQGTMPPDQEMKLLKLESQVAIADGKGEEAIKTIETIISRNPTDAEALMLAGDYYGANDEPEKADNRYQLASKIPGAEADAFVKIAQLHVRQRKYTEAVEFLRKAQRIDPKDNVQRYLEKVEEAASRAVRQ